MPEEPVEEENPAGTTRRPAPPSRIGATLAVVAVLLGVGAAYLLGTGRAPDAAPAASPAADPSQLGVVVAGTGSALGVPDQLRFSVTVRHGAPDVTAAMNATSADSRAVVRALRSAGVAKEDVRTAGVSVEPTYRYSNGQELITGYSASERMAVTVRDIKTAGTVIAAAANAAGNAARIGGIAMSVADPSALEAQARAQAIADARAKAEQFAKAAGRKLGEVVVVEESTPEEPQNYLARGALDALKADVATGVPINPGTRTTKVSVRVRWSFA